MFLQNVADNRFFRLGYAAAALIIALLYDFFVWDAPIGFGFLLWIVASLTLFTLGIFRTKRLRQQWAVLLLLPITVMTIDTMLYQNSLIVHGVPLAIATLSLFYMVLYPVENPNKERFLLRTIPFFRSIDLPFFQWGSMYRDLFRWRDDARHDVVRKVLIGVCIALPLIILFGWLFALADEVFRDWIIRVLDIEWLDVWRVFRTLVITLFLGSLFYAVIRPEYIVSHKEVRPRQLDTVIVSIVLFLVTALFAVFVFFQFKYIFGGQEALLQSGLTYAQYARKGFFELCWVIGLAAIMLLIIYRSFVFYARSWVVTILQTVLIMFVGVIAASALTRMNLYQEAFGFTVLRLYVEWFLYFIILILAFAGIALITRIPFRIFFYSVCILGVAAFSWVTSINVDEVIARENIQRFIEDQQPIDFAYLQQLSPDSTSAFLLLSKPAIFLTLPPSDQRAFASLLTSVEKKIAQRQSWKALHLGSLRAAEDLRTITSALHVQLRTLRLRDKQFTAVQTVLSTRPAAACQSFNEQPVRDQHPNSRFECVYQQSNGIQYVYVLQTPYTVFDEQTHEYDTAAALPSSLSVIDLSSGVVRSTFELPAIVRKEPNAHRRGISTHSSFMQNAREVYQEGVRYKVKNTYILLPQGRMIETDQHTGVHRQYTVVHDGASVRLVGPQEIQSLTL